ncbi:MAG: hypothetical protein KAV00_01845 [Phycisphaerae bacterium]|nr:hypothetical protein [Phycisphaerae bacterium]
MCQCISSKRVKIRKARPCFGCEMPQAVGTMMHAETTRDNGRLYTVHLCDHCKDAAMQHIGYGNAYYEGSLRELWSDDAIATLKAVE